MATLLQKNLAKEIVKNAKSSKPKNKQDLVISSGYAVKTAEGHAPDILKQKGVKQELKALGFDPENAKSKVGRILDSDVSQDKDVLKAADMVFKVHGTYAAEKHIVGTFALRELSDEQLRHLANGSSEGTS